MKTLLKIDSTDKIRIIKIWTEEDIIKRETGVLNGNLIPSSSQCGPKNIGRSNETTGEQQAILEMESTVREKCNEGYVDASDWDLSISDRNIMDKIKMNVTKAPQAMLAKVYEPKYADYINGVMVSAKLDGMRCMAVIPSVGDIVLWSRGGKQIDTMPHIIADCKKLQESGFVGILDGELYVHDKDADNFQEVMKSIKKYRPGISELVNYHVYELIDENENAAGRYNTIISTIIHLPLVSIKAHAQFICTSEESVMKFHEQFLSEGYEGTMVKNANSLYQQDKRSSDLLKLKNFQDAEFVIVDVVPMDRKPECGIVACKILTSNGMVQFKATPKMNYEARKELLTNRLDYVNCVGTVAFFGLTADGIPRFPVLKSIIKRGDPEDFRIK